MFENVFCEGDVIVHICGVSLVGGCVEETVNVLQVDLPGGWKERVCEYKDVGEGVGRV